MFIIINFATTSVVDRHHPSRRRANLGGVGGERDFLSDADRRPPVILSGWEAQLKLRSLVKRANVRANLVQKHTTRLRLRFQIQQIKPRVNVVEK
jgi:hypothetical protein